MNSLENAVKGAIGHKKASAGPAVLDLEIVRKSNIYGYHGSQKSLFLKIIVRLPSFIAACKRVFKEGFQVNGLGNVSCGTSFESNIPFALRFMIDLKIQGGSWISILKDDYILRKDSNSTCQIEVDVW